jgi:hypothetical protein
VNGARANDDEQPALGVSALDNGDGFIATLENRFAGFCRLGDLALQQVGRGEGVVAANAPVLRVVGIADGGVFDMELVGRVREAFVVRAALQTGRGNLQT